MLATVLIVGMVILKIYVKEKIMDEIKSLTQSGSLYLPEKYRT